MTVMRRSFRVRGRVQGVGYRNFAVARADELGIAGWVQNAADGSVVGEAEGEQSAIETFLGALLRGPRFAAVTALEQHDLAVTGEIGFRVR